MPAIQQELLDREREWMEMVQRQETSRIEEVLGHEYAYTASGQGRQTRAQWLATLPVYDLHTFSIHDFDLRDYGDIVITLLRIAMTATVHGTPRNGDFLITDVWVHRDDRWQVVSRSSISALAS